MLKAIPKKKTPRSKHYLAWIRKQACCICGWKPMYQTWGYKIHAHHTTIGGMRLKGSDYEAVPLCFLHHKAMDSKRKDDIPNLESIISDLQKRYTQETGKLLKGE